ncbi:PfkB [Penicillium expansum]|uniref:PfkB n=1 Tax=Penicillium expansum TaxID=27334 RepID=A0A0A2JMR7_PENEN|nr:PfkB [Penicillium expansum]KGO46578.1 PfkB [Penicillium expansum]KGO53585.1 PfkB [Penicillium expansum]KGO65879.1 PfkB [Penicillium expansum]
MVAQVQPIEVEFCTLGMFIIDDIDFGGSRPGVKNILGGAASFAVVGARLVSGSKYARSVSWIVDVGSDFPAETLDVIKSWNTDCVFREDPSRLTTRAWNGYHPDEKRDFKYLTPKLRLEPEMLSDSQVWSKTFHMVCSASRWKAPSAAHASKRPIFVWEPVPDLCTPEEQDKFFAANKVVDVVSPNHMELGMMFEQPGWTEKSQVGQQLVQKITDSGIGPDGNGMLVIRAGKDGSYAYSKSGKIWLPAYHQPDASGATPVIDPTGAGNSFLGALAQGMVTEGREPFQAIDSVLSNSETWNKALESWGNYQHYPMALICATVAAGFVVEQIGVPQIDVDGNGKELWNQTEFTERVRLYTQRLLRTLEESPQRHLLVN